MTRKWTTVGAAMLILTGLIVASAWAGPGLAQPTGQGESQLQSMSRGQVPFAARLQQQAGVKASRTQAMNELRNEAPKAAADTVSSAREKLDATLVGQLGESGADEKLAVVVTTSVDPADMKAALSGLKVTRTYRRAMYGFAAELTAAEIAVLKTMPEVERINADEKVTISIDNGSRWSGAAKLRDDFGLTGDGDGWRQRYSTRDVVIAVVDTGIDVNHKDLKGKVVGWKDLIGEKPQAYDDNGHGTHVAGIAAGAGVSNRNMAGVAPGAALVGVKVLDGDGAGSFSDVIAGIEWVIEMKDTYNIKVLNMSLGSSTPSDGLDALSRAVGGAVEAGIVAVVAAGNTGPDNYTIGSPAAAARAITVCALRDPGEQGWSLAPFSSRGPTADGRIKPDICAPGARISAPKAGSTDRYVAYSGTSMASPFVAGVVALMLEGNPYLTADEIAETLFSTAQDWGAPGKDVDYGYGRVNAYRAVQRILGLPGVGPSNPTHAVGKGKLESGAEIWYKITVTDVTKPVAATLVLTDVLTEYYDMDLYLFDADGTELAMAQDIARQETINFMAPKPGNYFLKVQAYEGSGPYTLDVSWR